MLSILRRRVFVNELLDIAEYLGQNDFEKGHSFIAACEETFATLAEMPYLGSSTNLTTLTYKTSACGTSKTTRNI